MEKSTPFLSVSYQGDNGIKALKKPDIIAKMPIISLRYNGHKAIHNGAGEGTRTPMPRRQILSLMRLPISPHPHYGYYCTKNLSIRLLLLFNPSLYEKVKYI